MKKLLALLLILPLVLVGCAKSEDADRISVVATLFPQYDFARNIAGESADVELLLDFGTDSHSYDPTPLDILKIAKADLFIYTGDAMELWAKKLLESSDIASAVESGSLKVLDLSKSVTPVCTHSHEDGHDHAHEDYDPHIWTSPKNAVAMCEAISMALSELDAENAPAYEANLADYSDRLLALDSELSDAVNSAKHSEVIFGGSFAFAYMFEEYGLSHVSVYEGCASHAEPSAAALTNVVNAAKNSGAKYVVYDTETEKKTAQIIANESGTELLRMHAIHNISKDEFDMGEDYISLTMSNIEALRKALS